MNVAPLLHPRNGKEILPACPLELALEELPQLEKSEEVRALVGEASMAFVGGGCALERPLARVAYGQRRGDDAYLLETAFRATRDKHAADPRIERQPRELAAGLGKRALFVHRTQLLEKRIAVGNCARTRRIEERKICDLAQAEAFGAKDYSRERGTQNLRIRERRAPVEVFFRIKAHAHPVRETA